MRVKMKQLAAVQMGYSFRSRLESSKGGDIAVIQMKDLLHNTVDCSNLTRIDMGTVKKHHLVQKNDLVFRSRGHDTTAALLLEDPGKAVVAAPLLRIRITQLDKIHPEYLNWFISQRDAQIFLTSRAKGTGQKMISKNTIDELEISLPSIEKQQYIVELASLSAREKSISSTLIEKREQYIDSILMQFAKGE